MKSQFVELLKNTNREGIDGVIDGLDKLGFFTAPASTRHHCAYEGGLLEHSLNVYRQMVQICRVESEMSSAVCILDDTIAITALLHDVCKADIYKKTEKFRKDQNGRWEKYEAWESDHSRMPLGHGEKSVIRLLRMGLDMKPSEIIAIRWHMGAWDISDYADARQGFNAACDKTPLLPILMAADNLASRISEHEAKTTC